MRAFPVIEHINFYRRQGEMPAPSAPVHHRAGRRRLDGAVVAPQKIEHEVFSIGEMEAEPVPACLFCGELV